MAEIVQKTLQDLFSEDRILQSFARDLEEKVRPRRRAIARDHGFLVRNKSEIRCRWHEYSSLVAVSDEKGVKQSTLFICERCLQEKMQPRDEELVNFVAAGATYAYFCMFCRGFVWGYPLVDIDSRQAHMCAVCNLNISVNRL
jgi:hypothetical protein